MKKSHLGLLVAGMALISTVAHAENTKLCLEAETATDIQPVLKKVTPGTSKDYSGKGYIHIPWDKNETKGKGQATLKVNVAKPGMYYVFARTFWENGCGNSIGLSINEQERMLGEDGSYGKWHWVGSKTRVDLKAGLNTILIKNRETGIKVDQIFFCTDSEYEPTKLRPITHDGATGNAVK